jgi:DNA-binding NtrC family response regulator
MILIIEDEHAIATALGTVGQRLGHAARLCSSGQRGLEELARGDFALAILDIGLPDMSGLAVLAKIRERVPQIPALIITAHGNLDNAVAARKLGAEAYLVKPLDLREVQETMRQLLAAKPAPPPPPREALSLLIGAAPVLQRTFVEIAHACTSEAPVLITGPTGTGKTLAARVIHANSARRDFPFVTLHCSALPEPLLEAELFGHEKGAFTGAASAKAGHIERAQGGTLFLDEIADIAPAIQSKLLRFVEERTFSRVGGREDLHVDLRLITATNKELREEVRAGRFREDLYYRLHVLEIFMPPLRERLADLPALASAFLAQLAPGRAPQLAPPTLEFLQRHAWPGNVRELRNVLEHAVAVSSGGLILPQHLPRDLHPPAAEAASSASLESALAAWLDDRLREGATYREMHDTIEATMLRHLLARFAGRPTILARETKMNRVTLRKKLAQLEGNISAQDNGGDDDEAA